jgi:hypothetical protein
MVRIPPIATFLRFVSHTMPSAVELPDGGAAKKDVLVTRRPPPGAQFARASGTRWRRRWHRTRPPFFRSEDAGRAGTRTCWAEGCCSGCWT